MFNFPMDLAHILFWNVRGLYSSAQQKSLRNLVSSMNIDVVCIQESKMSVCSHRVIQSMLGIDFYNNFICLPAIGASGGIVLAWRSRIGAILASRIHSFSTSVQFSSPSGVHWWLTCVYGPQGNDAKIAFMQEIRDIRAQCAGPWLIGGDFNLIYKDKDKNNSNLNRAMMGRFCWLINDLSIKEVPLVGRRFTWSSSVSGSSPMLVKLDWVFCSMDWEDIFPNCLLQSATNEDSDYCPLILGLVDGYPRKKRFRFECFWPKFQGFHEVVQTAWASVPPTRCPLETLSLSQDQSYYERVAELE
jgi:exonuclease III